MRYLMGQPLPQDPPFPDTSRRREPWAWLLEHERVNAMNARVLGYLLMYMPSVAPAGPAKLAMEILGCADSDALDRLARYYIDHFLRVCE